MLSLRIGSNADEKRMIKGFQLLVKMSNNMSNGARIENVVAVFSEGLDKPLDRYKTIVSPFDELENLKTRINATVSSPVKHVKKVPFYDWLTPNQEKSQGESKAATSTNDAPGQSMTDAEFQERKQKFLEKRREKKEEE